MLHRFVAWTFSILAAALIACAPALGADDKLSKEELQQLLAPIALYPDQLLTNVLIASTYPLDVVQAARWRAEKANAKLKGEALERALQSKEWDPSVKALAQFPDVLRNMSDKLEWTQKLGDAFLAQQEEVMDEIQFLRNKAYEAGNLKSNKHQKVTQSSSGGQPVYVIEPASPETVYVPVYQTTVVYGDWWDPTYPPYAWPYPGSSFINGFWWGAGVAIAAGIWDWNHVDWHHHDIDINVDKWNKINIDRGKIENPKWQHRPEQRGSVPYRNKDMREKFKQGDRTPKGKDEFRGRDRAEIEKRLKDTDRPRSENRAGDTGNKVRSKAGDRSGGKSKDRAGDRSPQRSQDRAKVKRPTPGAFDVKRGSDVRRDAARGKASRSAMRPSAGPRGGGGHRLGGGGGRGGGRRR